MTFVSGTVDRACRKGYATGILANVRRMSASTALVVFATCARAELVMDPGVAARPVPLESQTVRADIAGIVARVTVTQRYKALGGQKAAEAVFRFPLPHNSSVHEFRMTIGDREIIGVVEEREQALSDYMAAKAMGKSASLLSQESPNIFTMRLANLLPSRPIDVRFVYSQQIALDEDRYSFRFPLRVGERYTGEDRDPAHAESVTAHAGFGMFALDFAAVFSPDCEVIGLESVTHRDRVEIGDDGTVSLRLEPSDKKEDIELTYYLSQEERRVILLPQRPDPARPGYFMLLVVPEAEHEMKTLPKEFLFVLDVSGSMGGDKIEQGKRAVKGFIELLDPADTFNAYMFAGASTPFSESPVRATPANVQKAVAWVDTGSSGGGTNMLAAITSVLAPEPDPQRERVFVLISDGQVSAEDDIIKHVHENLGKGRAFTFAVGDTPNDHLMESIAHVGGGTCELVSNRADLAEKVLRFAGRSRRALLADVTLSWEGVAVEEVTPVVLPNLYPLRAVAIHGRYRKPGTGKLVIKGTGSDGIATSIETDVQLPRQTDLNPAVPYVWAASRIADILREGILDRMGEAEVQAAVTRLGLEHRLVTEWTSFIAIDNDPLSEIIARATAEARRQAIRSYKAAEAARLHAERARQTLADAKKVLKDAEKAAAESKRWSEASKHSAELSHKYARESSETLEKAREILARVQRGEAVLPPVSGSRMGRVYYSAMGVLALEVYYRYLPIYKSGGPPARLSSGSASGKPAGQAVAPQRPRRDLPPPPQPVIPDTPEPEELNDVLANMTPASMSGACGGAFGFRSGGGRRRASLRGGGSRRSDGCVDSSATWMTRAQEQDGHWDSIRWGAEVKADTTVTSLAVLCYLGAGHTEKTGQHKRVVGKAISWLVADLAQGGMMGEDDVEPVLAHAVATLALCEATGMANVEQTRKAAQRAVNALVSLQKRRSGWPSNVRAPGSELRPTVWAVMALKSAMVAKLRAPMSAFRDATAYLDLLERDAEGSPANGRRRGKTTSAARHFYDYEPVPPGKKDSGEALPTVMGIVARQMSGYKRTGLTDACRWAVGEREPKWPRADDADDGMRYFYFGTLASFNVGGDVWKKWNSIARDELIGHVARSADPDIDGSFDPTLPEVVMEKQ